jgi:uncharacterized protein YjbI with pentapeptide repeats
VTKTDLDAILGAHSLWLRGDAKGTRADLTGADLTDAVLTRADLRDADLTRAVLTDAVLTRADLTSAVLTRAVLRGADLTGADLTDVVLTDAVLTRAVLTRADLTGADLTRADLTDAVLTDAVLTRADLTDAVLTDAVLGHRSLLPETGSFRGWKKLNDGSLCEVEIPADAARTSSYIGRKCRSERVLVISGEGLSRHDGTTPYAPGLIVTPDEYDPDPRVECSHGIHFFLTRAEAGGF